MKTLTKMYPMITTVNTTKLRNYNAQKYMGNLNIFHNNLNGLENKFETLHNFLSGANFSFDIIAITENISEALK